MTQSNTSFEIKLGARLEHEWVVSSEEAHDFATRTQDWAPHHFDADVARSMGFEGPILHGLLLLSLTGKLTTSVLELSGTRGVTYGYDAVRFPQAAYVGRTVYFQYEVVELRTDKPIVVGKLTAVQDDRLCLAARHLLYLTTP